ncbi:5'-methylthioadenosine/S-adenosylhomocysteine nucleosidase [Paracoccus aerodenitrificans]|uniref:5'-methylthioadenosine/S-adenosylhomocysteine nucleosidase n=1 Tax=Paracoccus aerodenitrificans TaxID=3017781 RepID=UPI0022F09012|nr:5'-methylthioadenosine/S-adenosylhomocysteine nucleosidase [Paracoccus aerodenitrificans]WBU63325.1 5'-methylthioadenosine/S-adenosylhomocysteine nucleosidase [Paracoccus aerodenitrificans]
MNDLPPLTDLAGVPVLFVMAAQPEYGPELQARFTPLMTGIGPIEAALSLGAALTRLQIAGNLPRLVVSLGSAGSARLEQTAIYQASSVSWRDMDASALGFPKGVTPLLDLPETLPLDLRIPGIPEASLSTGANIVSGAGYDAIPEDMVDMESFAVLRACQQFGLPLIALRGISDGAEDLTQVSDWTRYLHIIDQRLGIAVDRLCDALSSGEIRV